MPTSEGTVVGIPTTNHFIATFTIQNSQLEYKFVGKLSGPTDTGFPPAPSNAILTYDDLTQLTGSRMFTALIGKENRFRIVMNNGVVVSGVLSMRVQVPEAVVGSGQWSESA